MFAIARTALTVLSLGFAGAVVAFQGNPFVTSPTEAIESQISEARAQIELVEMTRKLRDVQADVENQRMEAALVVENARKGYPDLVAFIEKNSGENVFAVAELVQAFVPKQ